jgi:hypothetical protein
MSSTWAHSRRVGVRGQERLAELGPLRRVLLVLDLQELERHLELGLEAVELIEAGVELRGLGGVDDRLHRQLELRLVERRLLHHRLVLRRQGRQPLLEGHAGRLVRRLCLRPQRRHVGDAGLERGDLLLRALQVAGRDQLHGIVEQAKQRIAVRAPHLADRLDQGALQLGGQRLALGGVVGRRLARPELALELLHLGPGEGEVAVAGRGLRFLQQGKGRLAGRAGQRAHLLDQESVELRLQLVELGVVLAA